MSNSPLVDYVKISPNKTSPRTHKIDTVTIHCVVGQCTVEALGENFARENRRASSNYGIGKDGRIGMYVEEGDRSWCSSNSKNDNRAITIEVASDTTEPYAVTDAAYKSLIDLLVDICQRNNIEELKWKADKSLVGHPEEQNMTVHRWFANKSCPGEFLYSRHGQIAAEVNARLGKVEKPVESKPVETAQFNEGDLVSIVGDAKYYNDIKVPEWVKNTNWYVVSAGGDRVVIDESEDGKNNIFSAIHAKYLKHVVPAAAKPEEKTENKVDESFLVKINVVRLNIRKGPGVNYGVASTTGPGVFTIVEVKEGSGSKSGWGRLKSGAGWISLDYTKRV